MLSGSVEKGHVEIGGSVEVVFFVYDGLDATQVARVLVVLGEFVVQAEVDWFVGVEGVFHMINGRKEIIL